MRGQVVEARAGQKRISGGWRESEVTGFAAIPVGSPSASKAVMTVTPVGRWASTSRKCAGSMGLTLQADRGLRAEPDRAGDRLAQRLVRFLDQHRYLIVVVAEGEDLGAGV